MNFRFADWALLAVMATALAACSGGGGGSSSSSGGTSLTAPGVTFDGITVKGAPVVSFTVKDSAGNPVTGLKLYNAADTSPCHGSNVTFAMAKYDGGNWQSLISLQRTADNPNGYIEGTTDPKPTATITNTDPSNPVVGTLDEANGVYTYHFATNVTTPLLMADAAAGKNVSDGKVANNGHLAVPDGQTIHRVALQLCFVDPATHATVKLNPYMDFTLDASGQGQAFTDGKGHLVPAIQVVDRASCDECHKNLAAHTDPNGPVQGVFIDPQTCVMCHNPGSTDFTTGNPIDFKLMIHKFHMGRRLTRDYVVGTTVAREDMGGGKIAGMLFPRDQRNCVTCHDGSATAAHPTPEGNYWIDYPSKNACFACHDDYKDPSSKWQAFHAKFANYAGMNLSDPDLIPDYVCQTCHNSLGGVAHTAAKEHEIQELTRGANYKLNIWGITKNPDNTVTVEYSVSDPKTGQDYDILDPQYQYTVVNGTTTTRMFRFGDLNMLFGWNTTDYSNQGAVGRAWSSSCTVAPTASPTCDPSSGMPEVAAAAPLTRGQPVSINAMFDPSVQRVGSSNHFKLTSTVLPTAANGSIVVAFQGYVSRMKQDLTGADIANTSIHIQVPNAVKYFAMNGKTTERRQVVSASTCDTCHGQNMAFVNIDSFLPVYDGNDGIHGGAQTDPQVCVICHNGDLDGTSALSGQADSGDFKRMIHMMHRAQGANFPVMPSTLIATAPMAGTYTGLKNCDLCHVNDSYMTNQSVLGSSILVNTTDPSDPMQNLVISPKAAVCSSCHVDSDSSDPVMMDHMISVGGASFGSVAQSGVISGQVFEACDGCHQSGAMEPVDVAHGLTP